MAQMREFGAFDLRFVGLNLAHSKSFMFQGLFLPLSVLLFQGFEATFYRFLACVRGVQCRRFKIKEMSSKTVLKC